MDKIIHHSVQLQCDPHRAFEMFTVNQLLESWMANVAEVEPVVGGKADPLTHVVVFFIPSDKGTNVHVIHSGWRSSAEWEEHRQWQDRAWYQVLQELNKQVNAKGA